MEEVYVVKSKLAKYIPLTTFTLLIDKIMQVKLEVEVSQEVLAAIMDGKCVEGRMRLQPSSKKNLCAIGFATYNRKPRGSQDKVICVLENGWLKESPRRIKFYNSVKKELGRRMVDVVMHRDLKSAMEVLEIQEILDNI